MNQAFLLVVVDLRLSEFCFAFFFPPHQFLSHTSNTGLPIGKFISAIHTIVCGSPWFASGASILPRTAPLFDVFLILRENCIRVLDGVRLPAVSVDLCACSIYCTWKLWMGRIDQCVISLIQTTNEKSLLETTMADFMGCVPESLGVIRSSFCTRVCN